MSDATGTPDQDGCEHEAALTRRTLVLDGGVRIHALLAGPENHDASVELPPLVLFVHGFPESWYSWRHQLRAVAAGGWRAAAIDVRGYGRSSKPVRIDEYRMLRLVADVVGVADALAPETRVYLVGHDWGAPIVWNSALLRPDRFAGVAGLSVPWAPTTATRPSEAFRAMAGEREFYIEVFQQPGRAEAEIERDVRGWLLGFYFSASGDAPAGTNIALVERGGEVRSKLVYPEDGTMPAWLTEEDLDFYVAEFERSGFTGGLNRYRNVDRDWEDFAAFRRRPIEIPSLFIGGGKDGPTVWGRPAIDRFGDTLPGLRGCHILDGCGHWIQQERAAEVNRLLLDFLAACEQRRTAVE
ncbi:MAG: alpha/beta hydrolase [Acidobacteria bacterium]|nr:MAG: alpha/beta hydrolase [Acidobacteriota bacterium]REK08896.1 MAG: alpha/beta hydrolase [Acidobacteriota bacterium]